MITHEMWRKTTTLDDICVLSNDTNFIYFVVGTRSGKTIVTLLIQTLVMERIVVSY